MNQDQTEQFRKRALSTAPDRKRPHRERIHPTHMDMLWAKEFSVRSVGLWADRQRLRPVVSNSNREVRSAGGDGDPNEHVASGSQRTMEEGDSLLSLLSIDPRPGYQVLCAFNKHRYPIKAGHHIRNGLCINTARQRGAFRRFGQWRGCKLSRLSGSQSIDDAV